MSAKTTRTLCFLAVMILAFGACTETVDSPPAPPTPSSWQGLPEVPTRPAAYVAALVDAWAHDDRGEMARYAPPSVVDSLTAVVIDNQSASYSWPGGLQSAFTVHGWTSSTVDGRDHDAIFGGFAEARPGRPHAVIARVEGK